MYYKGTGIDTLVEMGIQETMIDPEFVTHERMKWYHPPHPDVIKGLGMERHWYSYYKSWVPQENFYYAVTHAGFETNNLGHSEGTYTKYVSLDDRADGFRWYMSFMKFGMGRASRDAQQDIRRHHITRDEGIALVKRYNVEFPSQFHKWFLDYLNVTDNELCEYIDRYRELPNVWERSNNKWYLTDAVWYEKDDDERFSLINRPPQVHPRESRLDETKPGFRTKAV